jgi:hypothetical protein
MWLYFLKKCYLVQDPIMIDKVRTNMVHRQLTLVLEFLQIHSFYIIAHHQLLSENIISQGFLLGP